jgi:hypothetical protein
MYNQKRKKGNQMKELEIAIKQLKSAMKNIDAAEEKMWANGLKKNSDTAENVAIKIAGIVDEVSMLKSFTEAEMGDK